MFQASQSPVSSAPLSNTSATFLGVTPETCTDSTPEKSGDEAFARFRIEVNTADRAYRQLKSQISFEVEELWVLALDPRKTLLRSAMIFRGTVDACLVHPRDIFRFAFLSNASSFIVAHSHPSGDLIPSEQDLVFTQELLRAAKFMQVPLVDHLIVTNHGYSSFANEGWCRFAKLPG